MLKTFCYDNIPNGLTPSYLNSERKREEREKAKGRREKKSFMHVLCLEKIPAVKTLLWEKNCLILQNNCCFFNACLKYCHCGTENIILTVPVVT